MRQYLHSVTTGRCFVGDASVHPIALPIAVREGRLLKGSCIDVEGSLDSTNRVTAPGQIQPLSDLSRRDMKLN
jgi:hypothetical protein